MKNNIITLLFLLLLIQGFASTDTSKIIILQTVEREKNIIIDIFQSKNFSKFLDLLDDSVFFFISYNHDVFCYYYPQKEIVKVINYIYYEISPTKIKLYISDNNRINIVLYNNELTYPIKLTLVFNKKINKIYLSNERRN